MKMDWFTLEYPGKELGSGLSSTAVIVSCSGFMIRDWIVATTSTKDTAWTETVTGSDRPLWNTHKNQTGCS